jgi:hypothetical protein
VAPERERGEGREWGQRRRDRGWERVGGAWRVRRVGVGGFIKQGWCVGSDLWPMLGRPVVLCREPKIQLSTKAPLK